MKDLKKSIAKFALLAIMLCLCSVGAFAQSVVTGTVVDAENEPLPGVSVLVKNSDKTTVTDLDGKYSISAKKGDVIIFRFIGMKQVEEKV
ncbi:MAG: carboxypeptidase-like regulatory domain-containing protein, partial [Muribaculaceae bacterium]|nr:carboxypeptidase-like regulatory domain-containing protein [Muribaculaceae bacterium]